MATTRGFVFTRYFLPLALVCSQSWGAKVYTDDCRHWLEIGTGVVALHSKGGESLRDVLSYIDQYLSDSQIPAERRQQLLDRSRQVWDEGLMFGHDLEHQLLDKCDVQ